MLTKDNLEGGSLVDNIVLLSRYFGQWDALNHGFQNTYLGGGNSSVHTGDSMLVKLSGHFFSTITGAGFGRVDVNMAKAGLEGLKAECLEAMSEDYTADFTRVARLNAKVSELFRRGYRVGTGVGEPSVETGMHVQLAGTLSNPRYNMLDHNTMVKGLLCSNDCENMFQEIFGEDRSIRLMPFAEPGAPLSIAFSKMIKEAEGDGLPKAVLIAQHGKVQTAETPKGVVEIHDNIVGKIMIKIGAYIVEHQEWYPFGVVAPEIDGSVALPAVQFVKKLFSPKFTYAYTENSLLQHALCSQETLETLAQGFPNPDAVVYGRAAPLVVPYNEKPFLKRMEEAMAAYQERFKSLNQDKSPYTPRIVIVPGVCAITLGDTLKQADNAYLALMDTLCVARAAEAFGGMKPLSYKHMYYINNWAAEKKRQAIAELMPK